jgi:hypothetical protein
VRCQSREKYSNSAQQRRDEVSQKLSMLRVKEALTELLLNVKLDISLNVETQAPFNLNSFYISLTIVPNAFIYALDSFN